MVHTQVHTQARLGCDPVTAEQREAVRRAIDLAARVRLASDPLPVPHGERLCPEWGERILVGRQLVCSNRCKMRGLKRRAREQRLAEVASRACPGCGRPLHSRRRVTANWCSKACRYAGRARARRARRRLEQVEPLRVAENGQLGPGLQLGVEGAVGRAVDVDHGEAERLAPVGAIAARMPQHGQVGELPAPLLPRDLFGLRLAPERNAPAIPQAMASSATPTLLLR
jgi:hypothetical protein